MAAGDVNDEDSFKVRKGRVGDFVDYLSADDIDYVDKEMGRFDTAINYVT